MCLLKHYIDMLRMSKMKNGSFSILENNIHVAAAGNEDVVHGTEYRVTYFNNNFSNKRYILKTTTRNLQKTKFAPCSYIIPHM